MQNEKQKQVEFALTVDDMKALGRFLRERDRPAWLRVNRERIVAQAIVIALLVGYRVWFGYDIWLAGLIALNCAAVLFVGSDALLNKLRLEQWYQKLPTKAPHLFSPQLLRVTPNGLFQRNGEGEYITYWSVIAEVTETSGAVYLTWVRHDKDERQVALPAPRRAFASDEEMHDFALLARGYLDEARAAKSAATD